MYFIFDIEVLGNIVTKSWNQYYSYTDHEKYNVTIRQIAWVVLDENLCAEEYRSYNDNDLNDDMGLEYMIDELIEDIDRCSVIVSHNIEYDSNVLLSICHQNGLNKAIDIIKEKDHYCTMIHGKDILKIKYGCGYKYPSLDELHMYYFKKPVSHHHNAHFDTVACVKCFRYMIKNGDKSEDDDPNYEPNDSTDSSNQGSSSDDNENVLNILWGEYPQLFRSFTDARDYLMQHQPKIDSILEQDMYVKDRAELLELFEIYTQTPTLTPEWLDQKNNITKKQEEAVLKYKQDMDLDNEVRDYLEQERIKINAFPESNFENRILLLKVDDQYKRQVYYRYKKALLLGAGSEESGKIMEWIRTIVKIPFGVLKVTSEPKNVLLDLKLRLDSDFHGLEIVKEQILLYVNNRLNNPRIRDYPLCFIGPPGCGKTHLALTVARALDFPFKQLSGSCLSTIDGIHGHDYTYVGSQPGGLVKSIIEMGAINGIIVIDEFEKMDLNSSMSSILKIIDPLQNDGFNDNYVGDVDIDLSPIWFILSMNDLPDNRALCDRIFPINIEGYNCKDKFNILKNYALPKLLLKLNMTELQCDDAALENIIRRDDADVKGARRVIQRLKDVVYKLKFLSQNSDIDVSFRISSDLNHITENVVNKLLKQTANENNEWESMYL